MLDTKSFYPLNVFKNLVLGETELCLSFIKSNLVMFLLPDDNLIMGSRFNSWDLPGAIYLMIWNGDVEIAFLIYSVENLGRVWCKGWR